MTFVCHFKLLIVRREESVRGKSLSLQRGACEDLLKASSFPLSIAYKVTQIPSTGETASPSSGCFRSTTLVVHFFLLLLLLFHLLPLLCVALKRGRGETAGER